MDRRIRGRRSNSTIGILTALVLALVVGGLIYSFSGNTTNTADRDGSINANQSSGASGGRTGSTLERSTTTGETTPNSPSSNNSAGSITPPNPSTQPGNAGAR